MLTSTSQSRSDNPSTRGQIGGIVTPTRVFPIQPLHPCEVPQKSRETLLTPEPAKSYIPMIKWRFEMLSRTSEYALRAMIYLAQHQEEWPISGRQVAEETGIPTRYLSTLLSELVRAGVLESTRGKLGGFRMVRPPKETKLLEVLQPFEPFERRRCPFGNDRCSDEDPCLAHARWKKVVEAEQAFLRDTSVAEVAGKPPTVRVRG